MRRVLVLGVLMFLLLKGVAQNYQVCTYAFNGTPSNGVKIKTNLPYSNGSQMPTIFIEGYNYGDKTPIGITLVWYIYGGNFYYPKASSWGGYTPNIMLANENGKVVIFIDDKKYFNRFNVRAYALGMSESDAWFQGWTVVDESISGTNITPVPYENKIAGKLVVEGEANFNGTIRGNSGGGSIRVQSNYGYIELGPKNTDWAHIYTDRNRFIFNKDVYSIEGFSAYSTNDLYLKTNGNKRLTIDYSTGNVGIGTTDPGSFKLAVEGKIGAHEVVVTTDGWADFVFEDDYNLMSLKDLNKFIKQNKHLPEIPTTEEVEENGISVGEMNAKLLQKIEELTLYAIQQQEIIELLKNNNEVQKQINSELINRIEKLEKK